MIDASRSAAIRPLRASDLPALERLIDSTGLFPSELLPDMLVPTLDGSGAEGACLVLADPEPVALALYAPERLTRGTWNLLLLAVHRDRQGQGLGSVLIAKVERLLAKRRERLLLVETSGLPDFARTRAFYASRDYEQHARIRDFYDAGEDKIVFRKALAGLAVTG